MSEKKSFFMLFPTVLLMCMAICCTFPIEKSDIWLDMTYAYDQDTIYWPTAKGFQLNKVAWGINEAGWWYASNEYGASEHGGTHADAPIHFAQKGRTMDKIPIEEWIGPAVKIDVVKKCEDKLRERNYAKFFVVIIACICIGALIIYKKMHKSSSMQN